MSEISAALSLPDSILLSAANRQGECWWFLRLLSGSVAMFYVDLPAQYTATVIAPGIRELLKSKHVCLPSTLERKLLACN